ncbi:MAG: T9SS type A sorting domain-containing protein [Chitinophagaceae bacterium]|nr:T9SS type A sorting domain-containing protein [Chitinophagaceae bacterium]
MRKIFLLTAVIAMMASSAFSQQLNRCGTTEVMQQLFQENPGYRESLQQLDEFTNQFIQANPTGTRTVYTIPVVVHVVYNTTAENISDAKVISQIDVLNEDYRRLNPDVNETPAAFLGVAADCEINFCLAAQDPSGVATTGITRTSTTKTSFSSNNNVKFAAQGGHDAWDRTKYLNIWVCDLGASLLGYAQFPGGPANTDGVVLHYKYTGDIGATAPYQLGRSGTHEVGHWLNLYHIWGDDGTGCNGSDQVADTPNQADENYGCPLPTIRISCTNGPNGDMYSNYMDYTDDGCMNLFTLGQKTRMQAVLAPGGSRASLASSQGCVTPGGGGTCNVPAGLSATAVTTSGATLNWSAATGALSYNIQYKPTSSGTWSTTTSATTSVAVSGLTASTQYEFQVQSACANSSTSAFSASTNFTTTAPTCTDVYEANNNLGSAKPITPGVTINALIPVSTDKDFFSFANTVSEPNIQVLLTSLPANYNLDLYDPSGVKIVASKKTGTTDELIIKNAAAVGTYKVRVYPASGAFNATTCYALTASISSSPFRTVEIAAAKIGGEMTNIYPNPSNGNMVVEYNSASDASVQLIAYDLLGKVIFNQATYANEGSNSYSVNINNIATGVYVFEVRNGSETSRMKFSVDK